MSLFIKGLLIGIAKIMPGVSGALLAINFGIYEPLLNAITNFYYKPKDNLKFLIITISGIIISIVFGSKLILYLLNNYKFLTMMFFIGLISGGTYNFSKDIKLTKRHILPIILIVITLVLLSISTINNTYIIKHNITDNLIFFIGGFTEVFASIIPGISGTSLMMMLGIYEGVLTLISNALNYSYIASNISLYLSYTLGLIISFIINTKLITFLLANYRSSTHIVILALSLSSIIYMLIITIKIPITIITFILGIMLLTLGLLLSSILDK